VLIYSQLMLVYNQPWPTICAPGDILSTWLHAYEEELKEEAYTS